jgi:hypothetical protein
LKAGWKSSEFWLALVVIVGGAIASVYHSEPWAKVCGIIAAAIATGGYSISRGMAKTAAPLLLIGFLLAAGCTNTMPTTAQLSATTMVAQSTTSVALVALAADKPALVVPVAVDANAVAGIASTAASTGTVSFSSIEPQINAAIAATPALSAYAPIVEAAVDVALSGFSFKVNNSNAPFDAYVVAACTGVQSACQPYLPLSAKRK